MLALWKYSSEVVEKVAKEIIDDHNNETVNIQNLKLRDSIFLKAITIENLCYSYIVKEKSKAYKVLQNVRVGSREYVLRTSYIVEKGVRIFSWT